MSLKVCQVVNVHVLIQVREMNDFDVQRDSR